MATSLEVVPDASPETSSVDGKCEIVDVSATISQLRTGTGTQDTTDAATNGNVELTASTTTDEYTTMSVIFLLFDISALAADAVISAVELDLYPESVASGFDENISIREAVPATDTALVDADFDPTLFGSVNFAAPATSSFVAAALETVALNASGLALVQAAHAGAGIVRLGIAYTSFLDGTAPGAGWSSGTSDQLVLSMADNATAAQRPTLRLTYVNSAVIDEAVNIGEVRIGQLGLDAIINEAVNIAEAVAQGFAAVINEAVNLVEALSDPTLGVVINEAVNIVESIVSPLAIVIARILKSAIRGARFVQSFINTG